MSFPIYEQEIKDGLSEVIKANNTIAYVSEAKQIVSDDILKFVLEESIAKAKKESIDLFYMDSILASVGWNSNDDVFDKIESFKAKDTPIDKPFNFMHNETDIIGHMTASAILNEKGELINVTEAPDKYDIVVASVLYKKWENAELQERMNKIIAEIDQNKWFVSMECRFKNFDYAIISPEGEHRVIARNKDSAFLTKHLRAYGGKGEYNGSKVGRLLRDFFFSGKGLVDNPANKRSIIFKNSDIFNGTKASIKIITKGKTKMDEVLKSQVEELKKELEAAKAENKTFQAKAKEESDKANADKISKLETKISELTTANTEIAKTKETLEKTLSTKEEEVKTLTAKVDELNKAAIKSARLTKLAQAGVNGEEAIKLVDKFVTSSEEIFDEFVTLKSKMNEEMKKMMEEKNKKEKSKADESTETDKTGEVTADAAKVEDVKADDKTLTPSPEDATKTLRTAASAWINDILTTTAKKESK